MTTLEDAITAAAEAGWLGALARELPKLVLTRAEAAAVLAVSASTVDAMVSAGKLATIASGRITLASVLTIAGWSLEPAPLSAPLSAVPRLGHLAP